MIEQIVALAGCRQCEDAIWGLQPGDLLEVDMCPENYGDLLVFDTKGHEVGRVTGSNAMAVEVWGGARVLSALVNSISEPNDRRDYPQVRMRLTVGVEGESPNRVISRAATGAPTNYKIGLSGESFYQPAIRRCRAGDRVRLIHEPGNLHDARAIAAVTDDGRQLGYLPRGSWLTEVMLDGGCGVDAVIYSCERGSGPHLGVVLTVRPIGSEVEQREFSETARPDARTVAVAPAETATGGQGDVGHFRASDVVAVMSERLTKGLDALGITEVSLTQKDAALALGLINELAEVLEGAAHRPAE